MDEDDLHNIISFIGELNDFEVCKRLRKLKLNSLQSAIDKAQNIKWQVDADIECKKKRKNNRVRPSADDIEVPIIAATLAPSNPTTSGEDGLQVTISNESHSLIIEEL